MREVYVRTFVGVLSALALALAGSWVYGHGLPVEPRYVVGAVVLACLILLGDALPTYVDGRHTIGAWDIGLALAVAMLGPTWAAVAALPSALFVARRDWLRASYEAAHSVTIVHLAGMAYFLASAPLLSGDPVSATQAVYGTFAATVTLLAANKVIMALLAKVKYGRGIHQTWKEDQEPYLLSDAVNVLTAGLGVLALVVYGPVAAIVAVAGAVGSQALVYRSLEKVKEIGELRAKVSSLEETLSLSNVTFGTMIVRDLGRRDGFTDRHAAATAVYAADLAREMGMDETRVGRLRMAGLLHNVGLLGLPEELLLATGKPNSIAQSRLAEHPARGEEALAAVPELGEMAAWVRWHHERPDGRGYPDKLRGPWIPTEAKVLAVAQAYAALVLDGPSRPGVSPAQAREKLGAGADTEFDGVVVRALLRILDTESEGYRMADDHRFVFPAAGGGRGVNSHTPLPGREGHGTRSPGEERSQG